jgi:non-canonical (house-cleaning) NTP pyrophosphatase
LKLLVGTEEITVLKALKNVLSFPCHAHLQIEVVPTPVKIVYTRLPIHGFSDAVLIAKKRAIEALHSSARQGNERTIGFGVEQCLVRVEENTFEFSAMVLQFPSTARTNEHLIVGFSPSVVIPDQIVQEAIEHNETIDRVVSRLFTNATSEDPIQILTARCTSRLSILTDGIKQLFHTVQWT